MINKMKKMLGKINEKGKGLFPNKVKCVSAVLMDIFGFLVAGFGVLMYLYWDKEIKSFKLEGGEYLPDFKLDFSHFQDGMFRAICMCGIILVFSLITAHCKHPATSGIYMVIAVVVGM